MLVTCQITKEKIDKKVAYVIHEDNKNKYYKSKAIYDKYVEDNTNRQKIKDIIINICGMEQYSAMDKTANMLFNTKLKEIQFDLKIILLTLTNKKEELMNFTKKISSTSNKILYIFKVIIENINIGIEKNKLTNMQNNVIINLELFDEINSNISKRKKIDITKFLDKET